MTNIFTFAKVSTILVQYFCIKQLSSTYLLKDKLVHKKYAFQKIKHTAYALKEFPALPVLYWYIRKLRIIFKEVDTVLVQYCCLYQLLKNCFGGPTDAEYLCLN